MNNENNQLKANNQIYFSVLPSSAGFTDQLYQFSVFYKLGYALGLPYLHSKFYSNRQGSEEIYDFLGFNEQFSENNLNQKAKLYSFMGKNNCLSQGGMSYIRKLKFLLRKLKFKVVKKLFFSEFTFIDIGLDDKTLGNKKYENLEQVLIIFRSIISQNIGEHPDNKIVVRFYLTQGRNYSLYLAPLISKLFPYFQDGLDLYASYVQHRKKYPVKQFFSEHKIKLQMHIRLGDTAMIKTPWHSFVPLWSGRSISPLREYANKNTEVFRHTMDVDEFRHFFQIFSSYFNDDYLSPAIFSDGYNTTFNDLLRMKSDLELKNDQIKALKKSAVTYEREQFSVFNDIKSCTCIVGENNKNLQQLIHSSLLADVIVVGCNQNLIHKFLSVYSNRLRKHPPIIIYLHKDYVPSFEIPLDTRKAQVYYVNVNNLESDSSLMESIKEIKRRAARVVNFSNEHSTDI